MKIYADCCAFYKLSYFSFALFVTFMVAGCSSSPPITQTYTEYIPPIREKQKECVEKISDDLKNCQGRVSKEQQVCQKNALTTAKQSFAQAQVDYQKQLAALDEQRVKEREAQKLQSLGQRKEYEDCLQRKRQQEAQLLHDKEVGGGLGQSNTMIYIDSCISPQISGNGQAGFGGYAINPPEPQLEDFVQDAQCYASTECEGNYNHLYEECGGKVLITTRCFANCVGDEK